MEYFLEKKVVQTLLQIVFLRNHGTSIYPFMNHIFTKKIPTMH